MKFLVVLILNLIGPISYGVEVKSLNSNIEIEKLGGKFIAPVEFNKGYLDAEYRDYILNKHFKANIDKWDNFERDLLYKKLLMYSKKKVIKKYHFITNESYQHVMNDLKKIHIHERFFTKKKKY